jgi:transcriptional regulator with XRE-family HTH domain
MDRGMTQGQLALRLGVRQSMVSMIENDEELEDGLRYSDALAARIRAWIDSGAGPSKKSPRGPYVKLRATLPSRR